MKQKNQIKGKSKFEMTKELVGFIRDLGVIVGLPFLIVIGMNLYGKQIDALKAENESLKAKNDAVQAQADVYKQTQYPQALSLIDAQRILFEKERKSLSDQIASLESKGEQGTEQLENLKNKLKIVDIYLNDMREFSDGIVTVLRMTTSGLILANRYISYVQEEVQFSAQDDHIKNGLKEMLDVHNYAVRLTTKIASELEDKYKKMSEKFKNFE